MARAVLLAELANSHPWVGPWCAYFVSWAAREAGVPIGDAGLGRAHRRGRFAGADGTISTIEGSFSDSVARRSYGTDGGGASGYVRLG